MTSHIKIMKSRVSSSIKQVCLLGTILILGACGSTQPSSQPAISNVSPSKQPQQSTSMNDTKAKSMLTEIAISLRKKNLQPAIWQEDIVNYEAQKVVRATSKYVDLSDRVHSVSSKSKCSTRHLRVIKQAMTYHPSSLPMLSVVLECAVKYDMLEAQTAVANSIVLISSELVGDGQNGFSSNTPLQVREVYEAEYLLDLAGIELFDTEMVVEKDRILILHHGIDSLTNEYSLTYADQTDFFISSIKATLSNSEQEYFDDISSIIGIKKQALLSSQHYAIQLDSYRNMLLDGEYSTLVETINSRKHDTPLALGFLAQAHLALGSFDAQINIQDDLVYYAELGIPELQSIASQALLRMDVDSNVDVVHQAFKRTTAKIGLENASYLWVRTFLADADFKQYLDVLTKQFDSEVLEAWEQSLSYFARTRPQLSSSLRQRIKDFNNVLQAAQVGDIAMQGL